MKFVTPFARWNLPAVTVVSAVSLAGCNLQPTPSAPTRASETQAAKPAPTPKTQVAISDANTAKIRLDSTPEIVKAGQPATWTLQILDKKSGQPVTKFDAVHEKVLHLALVSKDFSWFTTAHPQYRGDGTFQFAATLPRAGDYRLYADFTAKTRGREVVQQDVRVTSPEPLSAAAELKADPLRDGWNLPEKRVTSAPEGQPSVGGGDAYQVSLSSRPPKIVAGQEVTLHFQLVNANEKYVSDLQPYQGALGQCVILSQDGGTYLHPPVLQSDGHTDHTHKAGAGPNVRFVTKFPKAGLYKVWGQFQHKGKIISAPFVLNVSKSAPA